LPILIVTPGVNGHTINLFPILNTAVPPKLYFTKWIPMALHERLWSVRESEMGPEVKGLQMKITINMFQSLPEDFLID
jgi:hypothetical protein